MHELLHSLSATVGGMIASAVAFASLVVPMQQAPAAPLPQSPAGIEIAYSAPVAAAFPQAPSKGRVLGEETSAAVTQAELDQGLHGLRQDVAALVVSLITELSSGPGMPASGAADMGNFVTHDFLSAQVESIYRAMSRNSGGGIADFSGLTAADIPALGYLPLAGGALTGNVTLPSLTTSATSTLAGITINTDCSAYNNGGKLTTDASGNIICDNDTAGTGGGTPGGSATQIQFNDAGNFDGDAGFTYSKTAGLLTVGFASTTGFSAIDASTTNLVVSGVQNALLKTVGGVVTAAVAGTDYLTSANISAYPFLSNATSTRLTFSGGLLSLASTTIGDGTAGLTVNGNATTTGQAYFGGRVGIGTAIPATALQIAASGNSQLRLGDSSGAFYFDIGRNGGTGAFTIQGNNTSAQNIALAPTSGNVGIGTTSPFAKFSVAGSSYLSGNVTTGSILTVGTGMNVDYQNAFAYSVSTTQGSNQVTLLSLASCPASPVSQSCAVTLEQAVYTAGSFSQPTYVTAVNGNTITLSTSALSTNASVTMQFGYNRWDTASTLLANTIGVNTGYFGAAALGASNWPNEYLSGSVQPTAASLFVISTSTSLGIFSAARSSDGTSWSPQQLLGVNDAATGKNMWGQYIESHSTNTSTGLTFNGEYSILNHGAVVSSIDPFTHNVNGMTENLRLDCGTGAANPLNCSDALQILNNGAPYSSAAIVIANNALATSTRANPTALALPAGVNGYAINWFTGAANIGWSLFSNATSSSLRTVQLGSNTMGITGANLAVGTTSASAGLEVFGSGQTTANLTDAGSRNDVLALFSNGGTNGNGGAIAFGNFQAQNAGSIGFAAIKGVLTSGSGNTTGDLAFATRNLSSDTSLIERMRITAAGNVGIGTTSPGSLLAVGNTNGINFSTATSTFSSTGGINLAGGCFAVNGACLSAGGGAFAFSYPFSSNATTTQLTFSSGLLSLASTTVGNGTQASGLTISGGATTTGNSYFGGAVGIGTTSPGSALSVSGNLYLTGSAIAAAPASADNSSTLVSSQWVKQFFPGLTTNAWSGIPGLSFTDCSTQATCGWSLEQDITNASQNNFTTFGSIRTETYSGGSSSDHGVNGNFYTTTSPYGKGWDRVIQATLHNTTLASMNAQHVALSGYAYRQMQVGTTTSYEPGSTWGGWFVCDDTSGLPNPTRGCTGSEHDVYIAPGGGADPNGQRMGILISAGAKTDDSNVHIGYGLKIQAVSSSTIDNGIYFGNCSDCSGGAGIPRGYYGNYISDALGRVRLTSDGTLALNSATSTPGLVLSGTGAYGSAALALNKLSSGQANTIFGNTNTSARWGVQLGDATAESGSNAGSNFSISRYSDAGSVLSTPFTIMRSSGYIGMGTTTPDAPLSIQSNQAVAMDLTVGGSQFLTLGRVGGSNSGVINSPLQNLILQSSGGNVGIGTTSPGATFAVTGSGYFSGGLTTGPIISAPTANYWLDSGPVNNVGIGGRLFVGPPYRNTGDKNTMGLYLKGVASWIDGEATMGYYDTRSQAEFVSGQGRLAIAAASRSSDNVDNSATDTAAIGVASFVLNDSTSTPKTAWAFYGHATQLENNRFTTAMELDTNSYKPLVNVSPYLMGADGTTAGMWLGVGGEDAAYVAAGNTYHGYTAADIQPVSVALGIVNSVSSIANNVFAKGIVIQDGALLKDSNGRSIWGQIADGQMLDFKYGGGASSTVGQMFSEAKGGSPNNQTHLVFAKYGFDIRGVNSNDYSQENQLFSIVAPATSGQTDYFQLTPGVAGSNAVTLAATGTDANVSINLLPKGSGSVAVGNGTGGLTVSGNATTTGSSLIGGGLNIGNPSFAPVPGGIYLQRTINPFISFVYGGTQAGQLRANAASQLSMTDSTGNVPYFSVNTGGTSAGNVGIGSTTPGSILSVNGVANFAPATSTFYSTGGINLAAGCFAISGACLSAGGGSSFAYPFPGNATSTLISFSGGIAASSTSYFSDISASGILNFSTTTTLGTTSLIRLGGADFITASTTANNLAFGLGALANANATGGHITSQNVAIGAQALYNLNNSGNDTFASGNVAMGYQAGISAGIGWNNVAIGSQALTGFTTGTSYSPNNNVAIGKQSLYRITSGGANICLGSTSCLSLTTGSSNVGLGSNAYLNNASGNFNLALGNQALYGLTGSKSYTIGLGYDVGHNTNASNNILIGNQVDAGARTTDNQLNIGNFLYAAGIGSSTIAWGGQSGVGTSSPFARFGIQLNRGDTNTTAFAIGSSTSSATTTLASIDNAGNAYFAGNVGIGTTTPNSLLSISGSAPTLTITDTRNQSPAIGTVLADIQFKSDDQSGGFQGLARASIGAVSEFDTTGIYTGLAFWTRNSTSLNESMRITNSGNVGIGTTTPARALQIASAGVAQLRLGEQSGSYYFDLGRDSTDGVFKIQGNNASAQNIALAPTSGNVGIGTASPTTNLDITGSGVAVATYITSTNAGGQAELQVRNNGATANNAVRIGALGSSYSGSGAFVQNGGFIGSDVSLAGGLSIMARASTGALRFYAGGSADANESMRITSAGNVGIGTTTPDAPFTIQSNQAVAMDLTSGGSQFLTLGRAAGTANGVISSPLGSLILQTGGAGRNVGIGTSTPYAKLTVWGTDAASSTLAFNIVNSASSTVFAVFNGGNAQLSGTLTQSSDQRLKTNVESLDASTTLAALEQLNPVTFNWIDRDKGNATQIGFIAQEVQKLFPDLVSTTSPTALTPDGTLGVNYIGFISPIIKGIQALAGKVNALAAAVSGFAQSFTSHEVHATDKLCVGNTCVTEAQLQQLLASQGMQGSAPASAPAGQPSAASSTASSGEASSTPPAEASAASDESSADSTSTSTPPADEPAVPAGGSSADSTASTSEAQ